MVINGEIGSTLIWIGRGAISQGESHKHSRVCDNSIVGIRTDRVDCLVTIFNKPFVTYKKKLHMKINILWGS
jgi:hypothetical protein